jgi:hypothetical protein
MIYVAKMYQCAVGYYYIAEMLIKGALIISVMMRMKINQEKTSVWKSWMVCFCADVVTLSPSHILP